MTLQIMTGDCIELMRTLPDNSVDSIVTDPPYGLGFMGKAWDALPPGLEWAEECLRVLKPGGHLLAFGGTRTWHRLAVAVEDAGFEIRDSIAWMYGSGFPKSQNVSAAIDRLAPPSRELTPEESRFCQWMREESGLTPAQCRALFTSDRFLTGEVEIINTATKDNPRMGRRAMVPTAAAWEAALPLLPEVPEWVSALVKSPPKPPLQTPSEWKSGKGEGTTGTNDWAGWGTALKPAFEPVVMGRKPFKGTVAANVLEHGTGALNIDASRIPATDKAKFPEGVISDTGTVFAHGTRPRGGDKNPDGRFPANVILDEHTAAVLDEQSGTSMSRGRFPASQTAHTASSYSIAGGKVQPQRDMETGGASRFFYVAKAPKKERPVVDGVAHPTVKPLSLMRYLIRMVTPPGGVVLEPFAGSGTTVEAALEEGVGIIAVERDETYLPLIQARIDRYLATQMEDLI